MANNRRTEKTLPHSLTHTHTRIMTKNAFCGTVDMLPPAYTPLQLLGSPISGWFIMQKLCKDKQNYESRQQPASKNSTATLCHILLHKASHISPTVLLFPKPKRQSLSGYHSPVPISITKPIPESISLSFSCSLTPSLPFHCWLWAVNGNCFSENGQLFSWLTGTATVASF